jgi:cell shape-determining protein MreD
MPNFTIYHGMILLPVLVIVYKMTLNQNPKKNRQIYIFSLFMGLFLDVFSGGHFLSFTIILFTITALLDLLKRITLVENLPVFANLSLILAVFCYDAIFMLINRIVQFDNQAVLALVFDLILTSVLFWVIMAITSRFNRHHRLAEIKI